MWALKMLRWCEYQRTHFRRQPPPPPAGPVFHPLTSFSQQSTTWCIMTHASLGHGLHILAAVESKSICGHPCHPTPSPGPSGRAQAAGARTPGGGGASAKQRRAQRQQPPVSARETAAAHGIRRTSRRHATAGWRPQRGHTYTSLMALLGVYCCLHLKCIERNAICSCLPLFRTSRHVNQGQECHMPRAPSPTAVVDRRLLSVNCQPMVVDGGWLAIDSGWWGINKTRLAGRQFGEVLGQRRPAISFSSIAGNPLPRASS